MRLCRRSRVRAARRSESCETTPCPLSRSIGKTYQTKRASRGSRQYFMMNCYLGQTARAFARNFYNPHGQSSKFLFTRRKAMFFPPIGVKRVRLKEALKADGADGGGTLQFAGIDDFGEDGAANNHMIRNILFGESTFYCKFQNCCYDSSKEITRGNSRCQIRSKRLRRELRLWHRIAPTLRNGERRPGSDSDWRRNYRKGRWTRLRALPASAPGASKVTSSSSTAQLRRPLGSALWPTWISNRPGSSTGSRFGPTNDRSSTGSRHVTSLRSPAARTAFCTPLSSSKRPGDARHGIAHEQKQGRLTVDRALVMDRKRHLDRVFRVHAGRLAAKIAQRKAAV